MQLNPALKWKLARLLPSGAFPILNAGIGRVGSTLVWRAIIQARARAIFGFSRYSGSGLILETVWELKGKTFRHGAVYKTHDLPHDLVCTTPMKVVFLYARPSDCVLSVLRCRETKGLAWVQRHFAHMHASGDFDDLLHKDVLRIGEQVRAWRAAANADILGLRYETLWNNRRILTDFLGLEVNLPPRIERTFSDVSPKDIALARSSYRDLDEMVDGLPDYFCSTRP